MWHGIEIEGFLREKNKLFIMYECHDGSTLKSKDTVLIKSSSARYITKLQGEVHLAG